MVFMLVFQIHVILAVRAENTWKLAFITGNRRPPKEARGAPLHPTVSLMRSQQREKQAKREPASEPILHPGARKRLPR